MFAGLEQISITPRPGIDMTGYIAREGPSNGVMDRLYARALMMMDDHWGRLGIITADLIGLDAAFVKRVRRAIAEKTNLPPDRLMIACSHTHAGPATMHLQDCGKVNARYMDRLEKALVKVAWEAQRMMCSVRLEVGHGTVSTGKVNDGSAAA